MKAAQQLADGKLWFIDRWLTPAEFAAATAEAAKEQTRVKLAADRAATLAGMDAKAELEREEAEEAKAIKLTSVAESRLTPRDLSAENTPMDQFLRNRHLQQKGTGLPNADHSAA